MNPPRFALSPDGSMIAYIGLGPSGRQIWLRRRDQLHATVLPGTEGMYRPFFSPDGEYLGFQDEGEVIRVMAIGGGAPIVVVDSGGGNEGASWGPDGYIYYDGLTGGGDVGLKRIPEFGGTVEQLTTVDTESGESNHTFPDILPNGKGLIFRIERRGQDTDIAVLDLSSREYRVLLRGAYARYSASGHLIYVTSDGTLIAVPFDQDALELTGGPISLVTGVRVAGSGIDIAPLNPLPPEYPPASISERL